MAIVVIAYVLRPFREVSEEGALDRAIEAWIAELSADAGALESSRYNGDSETAHQVQHEDARPAGGVINYCSQCGRRVSSEDRYCSGCGYRLGGGNR